MTTLRNPLLPLIPIVPTVLDGVPRARMMAMRAAGERVLQAEQQLLDQGSSVVGEILKDSPDFYQWDHYPNGDVYDWDTHAQYYYHAHPPDKRDNQWADEHGHFHTFLRPRGFPEGVQRIPDAHPDDNDAVSHIIAISMDATGQAQRLFTTNRWVTGETWYPAADVKRMLENFRVTHDAPSGAVNMWITSMLELFGPTIEALLDARDATVAARASDEVHNDHALEVTSLADISVSEKCAALDAALA